MIHHTFLIEIKVDKSCKSKFWLNDAKSIPNQYMAFIGSLDAADSARCAITALAFMAQ